ncbi:SIMPL domain-containing protein [Thiohalomonas denitrificans]|uniref:SIMPL domain-containing protein n=1 Tax=Thiohalomonas denitrificans TaxID=415747 RepID=UPI0026F145F4|nr:SIMPL domain-containing protein [Thiohalomonas denitrificans]
MSMRWFLLSLVMMTGIAAADDEAVFDRVSLQAEVSREVENDRMRAVLAVQEEGSDPAQLAERINQAMRWALGQVESFESVTGETGGYRTRPVYQKGTLTHWRAVQSLRLESGDFTALSSLVGQLQEKIQVQSMGFEVSEKTRRAAENDLIDDALGAFKVRAERVRQNLGAGDWRIVQLNIGTRGNGPGPVYRMETMAERAPPAVKGGETTVSVIVSGTIQLLPGKP